MNAGVKRAALLRPQRMPHSHHAPTLTFPKGLNLISNKRIPFSEISTLISIQSWRERFGINYSPVSNSVCVCGWVDGLVDGGGLNYGFGIILVKIQILSSNKLKNKAYYT